MGRVLLPLALLCLGLACGGGHDASSQFSRPLPIPPQAAATVAPDGTLQYALTAQAGSTEFRPGKTTETYGYNGAFLGPTLRLRRGVATAITLNNALPESAHDHTNLHWHGLKVPAAVDIVPEGMHGLHPGHTVTATFTPDQPAATLWYHPHPHGYTGFQVTMGLAGFLFLDDAVSDALPLPKTYGVDDVPIVVQDRRFKADGAFSYMDRASDGDRMLGDQILVNGALTPYLDVPKGTVRLRLLNGSSVRRYLFAFEDGRTFHHIASDGGFLEAPVPLTQLMVGPAERAEILVDFSQEAPGRRLLLRSLPFQAAAGEVEDSSAPQGLGFPILEVRVGASGSALPIPSSLTSVPRTPESEAAFTRTWRLEDGGDGTINGLHFDMDRIDATVQAGATEIWVIENDADDIAHPFHIHGGQFQILDRSSGDLAPSERGWKDTVLVQPHETARIIMRFKDLLGVYPFHCHILEHEDGVNADPSQDHGGMMGQFEVK